jgi:hypothetical protein
MRRAPTVRDVMQGRGSPDRGAVPPPGRARFLAAGFAFVACVAAATGARADADNPVAVVGLDPGHPLARQLRAELGTLGFRVVVSGEKVVSWKQLQSLARGLQVAAAIWVPSVDQPRLEIWVVDRVTGKTVERTVRVREAVSPEANRIIAMRVIELLRASFRELELSERPLEESEVQPSAAVRNLAGGENEKRVSSAFFGVGPSLATSPGGLGPLFDLRLGLRWLFFARWGLDAYALLPAAGAEVEAEEGSARVFFASAGIGPSYLLTRPESSWHLDLGAGLGAALLPMQGEAGGAWEGRTQLATSIPVYGRAGIAARIARGDLRLRLDLQSGALLPRATVRFAGRDVAHWGGFFLIASLMLELGLR